MTNAEYFAFALAKIGVLAEGEPVSAEQGADMLDILNDLLDDLRGQSIELGIEPQSSTTATLVVPEGYKQTIKYLLAVHAAPHFQVPIPIEVAGIADAGFKRMLRDSVYANAQTRDFDHLPYKNGRRFNILTG